MISPLGGHPNRGRFSDDLARSWFWHEKFQSDNGSIENLKRVCALDTAAISLCLALDPDPPVTLTLSTTIDYTPIFIRLALSLEIDHSK